MNKGKLIATAFIGVVCLCVAAFARQPEQAKPFDLQKFFQSAAQADMLQAHIGQMANTHSSRAGVRDLGGQIAAQKTASYQKLSLLADKLGVAIPKAIDETGIRIVEKLDRLHGTVFDREFAREIVAAATRESAAFKLAVNDAQNPEVKQYAANALSNIDLNLNEARDLERYGLNQK